MEVKRSAALKLNFPTISLVSFDPATQQISRGNYATGRRQRDEQVREIEQFFEEARRYQAAKKAGGARTDLKLEAMLPVLDGKLPVMIFASREREIREAVAFAEKQKIRIVLAGVQRAGAMAVELGKKQIPAVLGSPFTPGLEPDDPYDATFALAGELHKAGVKIAFASFGAQFARNLPYQAGQAIAYGLPPAEGLKAVTVNAAEIFGVADQIGSVEKGKWADLMVTDGDPLEIRTQVKMLFVKGESVDLESKHTRLYKKYLARP
jgi:imidazolonepropionase-like amidohydrolase